MADISNKTLATFLFIATIVSLGGFILTFNTLDTLSGRATTDTGQSNFSINSTISVAFTTSLVEFGQGIVNASEAHNCTLNTSGPGMWNASLGNAILGPDCIGFNQTVPPLRVQNQGTQNVSLNISFNATGAQFITGTNPAMTFLASYNDSGSCDSAPGTYFNDVQTLVTAANTNYSICNSTKFDWRSNSRTLNIDLGIKIPQDAQAGSKRLLITAYASSP